MLLTLSHTAADPDARHAAKVSSVSCVFLLFLKSNDQHRALIERRKQDAQKIAKLPSTTDVTSLFTDIAGQLAVQELDQVLRTPQSDPEVVYSQLLVALE